MATRFDGDGNPLDEPSPYQMRFEDERVKMVLKEFKLLRHLRSMLDDYDCQHGMGRLTFESLNRLFPTFPIVLAACWRSRVAEQWPPAALFRSFGDAFLMQHYVGVYARYEEEAGHRPIGLVVPFDGYRGGVLVHNGLYEGSSPTRMVHDISGDKPPHRVTVEPFTALLQYLARADWTPRSPLPARPQTQHAQTRLDMPITPWMVELLGPGPALVVLAWLRKVLSSPSGDDHSYVRRTREGNRCVAATQQDIAAETRLSPRRVKRGLADLSREGLVSIKPRQGQSYIALTSAALAADGTDPDTAL